MEPVFSPSQLLSVFPSSSHFFPALLWVLHRLHFLPATCFCVGSSPCAAVQFWILLQHGQSFICSFLQVTSMCSSMNSSMAVVWKSAPLWALHGLLYPECCRAAPYPALPSLLLAMCCVPSSTQAVSRHLRAAAWPCPALHCARAIGACWNCL